MHTHSYTHNSYLNWVTIILRFGYRRVRRNLTFYTKTEFCKDSTTQHGLILFSCLYLSETEYFFFLLYAVRNNVTNLIFIVKYIWSWFCLSNFIKQTGVFVVKPKNQSIINFCCLFSLRCVCNLHNGHVFIYTIFHYLSQFIVISEWLHISKNILFDLLICFIIW